MAGLPELLASVKTLTNAVLHRMHDGEICKRERQARGCSQTRWEGQRLLYLQNMVQNNYKRLF
jgi:hypothetical protein